MSTATKKLQLLGTMGVNPDYSQNDTTKKDHIKNRPFYVDDEGKVHPIDAKFLPDNMYERLVNAENNIADLKYEPMAIKVLSVRPGLVEIGSTVTDVILEWTLNKIATKVTLDGLEQPTDVSLAFALTEQSITTNKSFTLVATDEREATASKTTRITFSNSVYYGATTAVDTYDSAFILSLFKDIRTSKLTSFSANAGEGQYIYYCLPVRYGTCSFTVGGFTGGFTLVDTIGFTNASGYTEQYYIYKSDNANLGSTKITVA